MNTCEEFYDNTGMFDHFKLKSNLLKELKENTAKFNKNTIGIHIRRTDNIDSILNSPTELFKFYMDKELENNPDVNFFLSTDDLIVENELKFHYPHKILTREKELSRNKEKGITDAAIDLFCLAKTVKIYGSYWSSFSDIAARIGKIQLVVIKKD